MNATAMVWIFVGVGAAFPSGVFVDLGEAELWIRKHSLSGTLTQYPIGTGIFDWAVASGDFIPRKDSERSAEFIGRFSSATQEHYHYEFGRRG